MKHLLLVIILTLATAAVVSGQDRRPSMTSRPWTIKTKSQVKDIRDALERQSGNTNQDIVSAASSQVRVAIFKDDKREGDPNELHDGSDDIYYVLDGQASLILGGTLVEPSEISPGEWRSKTAAGGDTVAVKAGDLIIIPRGTRHQRTVTKKGFSMILIKVFADKQPGK